MKTRILTAAAIVALSVAWGGGAPGARVAQGSTPPIKVTEKEFLFVPKTLMAQSGAFQIVVTNVGTVEHSFVIDALKVKSGPIKPGQTITLTVRPKPGSYAVYCDVPGHKEAGMTATLVVK